MCLREVAMNVETHNLGARVTKEKSSESDRFQCSDVYQLWDDGEVTIDHCVEDEEWGSIDETSEVVEETELPEHFFKAGMSRVIDHAGTLLEAPL
jgi:hypothetical protein